MQRSHAVKGTGVVQVGGTTVRGYFVYDRDESDGGRCRVRVDRDEGATLNVESERRVWVRLPGAAEWAVRLRGVLEQPSFVWLEFEGEGGKPRRAGVGRGRPLARRYAPV